MRIDLGSTEAWEPNTGNRLGVGEFMCVLQESEANRSSGNHPQIEMRWEDENGAGDTKDWLVITPNNVGKVVQLVEALGVEKPASLDTDSQEWADYVRRLAGHKAGIVIRNEDDLKKQREGIENAQRPRVQAYLKKEEYAELKQKQGGAKQAAGAASSLAQAFSGDPGSQAPSRADDDIPF